MSLHGLLSVGGTARQRAACNRSPTHDRPPHQPRAIQVSLKQERCWTAFCPPLGWAVQDDNGRLVALLASTPQFSGLSAELSSGSGLTYLPLGDLLLQQGLVGQAYLQLTDRWVGAVHVRCKCCGRWQRGSPLTQPAPASRTDAHACRVTHQ